MPQDGGMGPRNPTGLSDNYKMRPLGYVRHNRGNGGVEGDNLATPATAKASEKLSDFFSRYSFLCQTCMHNAPKLPEDLAALN